MRILYLTHRLPYTANRGDRVRAHQMMSYLARRAQVDLVSLVHNDDEQGHADDVRGMVASVTTVRVHPRVVAYGRAALTRA